MTMAARKLKLAVWKFASCDGCQLSLLDLEDELLELAEKVEISYFLEASSTARRGPYDVSLVDGSISTPRDLVRIQRIRRASKIVVPIGACAVAGGIQSLRNFHDASEMMAHVYPEPARISALPTSTSIADNVRVELEVPGCPVNKYALLEVVSARLNGRAPVLATHSVCVECKLIRNVCVMVTGTPCMGPVTRAGCGALCPSYHRGCYACFGPMETPNTASIANAFRAAGYGEAGLARVFRNFNANAAAFRDEGTLHEHQDRAR
jgi:coenzyme F420-reducing hydrogenase gamma subunit